MTAEFIAIDLETASSDASSICQIGVARYLNGELAEEWMSYIDPEVQFMPHNIAIHGINAAAVSGWPKLPEVAGRLQEMLNDKIVVSHSQFDRVALERAFDRYEIPRLNCAWLDSTDVARRAWEGFAQRGFALENLCRHLGYRYQRHDALGDAKAAGVVVLAAIEQTGIGLSGWLRQVEQPINEGPRQPIRTLTTVPANPDPEQARPTNRLFSPEILRLLSGDDAGG